MDPLRLHRLRQGLLPYEPFRRRWAQHLEQHVHLQNAHILVHRPENRKLSWLDIDRAEDRYLLSAGKSKHIRIHDLEPVRSHSLGLPSSNSGDIDDDGGGGDDDEDGLHAVEGALASDALDAQPSSAPPASSTRSRSRPIISYGGARGGPASRTRQQERARACRVPEVAYISASRGGAHTANIGTVQWYPQDSGIFTSSSSDGTLKCWDTNELCVVEEFRGFQRVRHHAQSPVASGHELIALATEPAVVLCDLRTGMSTHTLSIHQKASTCVCWSPSNEHLLVSGTMDGQVLVWDVRRAKPCLTVLDAQNNAQATARMRRAHYGAVAFAAFTPDGEHIVTCGQHRRKWDARTFKNTMLHFSKDNSTSARSCAITNAFGIPLMYSATRDHTGLLVHDLNTGKVVSTLLGHFSDVTAITATHAKCQQPIVVSASDIGSIAVWAAPSVASASPMSSTTSTASSSSSSSSSAAATQLATAMAPLSQRYPNPVRHSIRPHCVSPFMDPSTLPSFLPKMLQERRRHKLPRIFLTAEERQRYMQRQNMRAHARKASASNAKAAHPQMLEHSTSGLSAGTTPSASASRPAPAQRPGGFLPESGIAPVAEHGRRQQQQRARKRAVQSRQRQEKPQPTHSRSIGNVSEAGEPARKAPRVNAPRSPPPQPSSHSQPSPCLISQPTAAATATSSSSSPPVSTGTAATKPPATPPAHNARPLPANTALPLSSERLAPPSAVTTMEDTAGVDDDESDWSSDGDDEEEQ